MESLTFQDTQNLLHAIQELYTFHDLSSFGEKALAIANQLVPSEIPEFFTLNPRSRQISHTFLPDYPSFTLEMQEVPRQYWGQHPLTRNMPRTLDGAYKISDFATQTEFHHLEGLYQQFLRVMDCEDQMAIFLSDIKIQNWNELLHFDIELFGFALNRSQRNFTERDRLILNLLRPHLFQAYSNAQHYHQLQQNLTQFCQSLDCLSLIILNTSGHIQFITSQATQHLQRYFAESNESLPLPAHLWAWVKHQISSVAHSSELPNARLPLRIEQDGKQLVIRLVVEQNDDRYLLLLEEQTLSLLPSLELLGLSPRETEVLYWVIRGEDNQSIAKHLGIHLGTVRKHLESIFHKLGVQSRTEAIAQALEKLGVLNSSPLT
jgi:DNA-binding CsgD family transcriptional regulator